ncbi:hypothetical protein H0H81_008876 [Sphagnurus paluster]|uniref:2-deoxyglucose-6-phosphate phosphatase n=1 Tax=Sphagnurus paluster TaxID=117069 RepID=A0A9P7GIQ5_9AGAR|nr:hypothetical protein H0H81_008876 [Sphagnurus paluster]
MSATTFLVDAILFDMDGTLVDSTAGVIGAWELFRKKYPDTDKEAERFEQAIVSTSKEDGRPGIVVLPGVAAALEEV